MQIITSLMADLSWHLLIYSSLKPLIVGILLSCIINFIRSSIFFVKDKRMVFELGTAGSTGVQHKTGHNKNAQKTSANASPGLESG